MPHLAQHLGALFVRLRPELSIPARLVLKRQPLKALLCRDALSGERPIPAPVEQQITLARPALRVVTDVADFRGAQADGARITGGFFWRNGASAQGAIGIQRGALRVAQLRAVAVEVAADLRPEQPDLALAFRVAQEHVAFSLQPIGIQRGALRDAQLRAVAVEVAADLRPEQPDLALAFRVAQEHAALGLQPIGIQRGALRVAQLRAVAVEVTADLRSEQADLAFAFRAAQEHAASGVQPIGPKPGQVRFVQEQPLHPGTPQVRCLCEPAVDQHHIPRDFRPLQTQCCVGVVAVLFTGDQSALDLHAFFVQPVFAALTAQDHPAQEPCADPSVSARICTGHVYAKYDELPCVQLVEDPLLANGQVFFKILKAAGLGFGHILQVL